MNNQCNPLTELAIDTPVRVGTKTGVVVSVKKHNAIPSDFIFVHLVHFTSKRIKKAGKYEQVPINETWRGNYSALYY